MVSSPRPAPSRRPTIRDVAAQSGVSRATVSYVLNNNPNQSIPEATRSRVLDAAAALGYVPSAAAVALRRGHSNIVLVVKDAAMSGYVTEPFLASISERLTEAGYTALTTDHTSPEALLALARELRPFGVIVLAPIAHDVLDSLVDLGVQRSYHSFAGAEPDASPRPWESEIGAVQARFLLSLRVDSLVFALPEADSPRDSIARSRADGAARVWTQSGGAQLPSVRVNGDRTSAAAVMRGLTELPGRIGVCCFDDTVAASALAGALDAGLRIPDDLMLIGVDDSPFASMMTPSLSSVRVDAQANGRAIADRLLGLPSDAPQATDTLRVIARDSTGLPRAQR